MTKHSQESGNAQTKAKLSVFDPIAIMSEFMSKMDGSSSPADNPMGGWFEMNQHWMNFLSQRFKQDAALLRHLSTCSNPTEMTSAYSEFYKAAVDDYQSEFAEIANLGQKAMRRATGTEDSGTKTSASRKS